MRSAGWIVLLAAVVGIGCGDAQTPTSGNADPVEERIQSLFPTDYSFGAVDRSQVRRMLELPPEEDRPFYMINLIRFREHAEYPDGRESDLTGEQADAIYASQILPILLDIGARPVFVAGVNLNLVSGDGTAWDQVSVVLYPSRARFFEMLERKDAQAAVVHKEAGVEKTIVLVSEVEGEGIPDELRRVDLTTVPIPPTPEDPPISVIHLHGYHEKAQYLDGRETDLTGSEAMRLYEQGRGNQNVVALGIRIGLRLRIEGAFIGDGRSWNVFRINNFPNQTTFFEVASQESLAEAGIEHWQAAIRDAYSLLTAPFLTEVGYD